jgi:hypothetical protein
MRFTVELLRAKWEGVALFGRRKQSERLENWREVQARGLGQAAAARPTQPKSPRTQTRRMPSLALERVAPSPF